MVSIPVFSILSGKIGKSVVFLDGYFEIGQNWREKWWFLIEKSVGFWTFEVKIDGKKGRILISNKKDPWHFT
jgi:hypothetical protein